MNYHHHHHHRHHQKCCGETYFLFNVFRYNETVKCCKNISSSSSSSRTGEKYRFAQSIRENLNAISNVEDEIIVVARPTSCSK
jgi:protein required for attachment to host cells